MSDAESQLRQQDTVSADPPNLQRWITKPRILILIGGVSVAIGLATSWNWLAAVGAAPIIVALLPCAAMCALGLCKFGKKR